ncbi:MAG: sensor histidine kinase [Mariniphaga sp.]
MALVLLLIVFFIIGLVHEKSRIQSALDLSQQNRDQLLQTESVTQSIVVVEAKFREYCTTFEKSVFEEYQNQVKLLARNIALLQQTFEENPTGKAGKFTEIVDAKTSEAENYMKLRLITDSLIFSVENLEENKTELEKYIGDQSDLKIDTLSVTETTEVQKKGILGKIKSAIVGETVQQSVNTKLRVQSGNEPDRNNIRRAMVQALQVNMVSANAPNFNELVKRTVELKESELKLITINNNLIAQIQELIEEIKSSIREQEAAQNSLFLKSVRYSTNFLQNTLIVLMVLACILAFYSLRLAFRNDKFQNNIIALNEKITKDSIEKDKFYSIINHDIMNPFNTLLGYSQVLKDAVKEGDEEEIEECSTIVNQSANRISKLLQNLLVWSKVQNGKLQFSPKPCNINRLVSETVEIVAPIAKNKDIKLSWEVKGEINAEIDRNMISSVLQNLTTNAIKFTEKGGEVKLSAFTESGNLNFIVSDTGVGMNEEQLQRLFKLDKASSSRGTADETGTGLGLIISKEFVEKHQGRIWAESVLGEGSTFCCTIPENQK